MKNYIIILFSLLFSTAAQGQQFEERAVPESNGNFPKVKLGGDFTIQFQGLEHHADTAHLIPLGKGINLPSANFNLDATLADGIGVNLTTYLSSRHHNEAWVKGGYMLIDKLPFIKSKIVTRAMDYLTFKIGVMEINYGDAHFRRTDNGRAGTNSFVGNYIIDGFTTAPAFEAWYKNNGILVMGAVTSGSLKPELSGYNSATGKYSSYNLWDEPGFYGKVGYDKQISDHFRLRITASAYHATKHHSGSLYFGDRAGSRFFLVMQRITSNPSDVDPAVNAFTGNWGPGFTYKDNSLMVNLFTRLQGFELFATYESLKGTRLNGSEFNFSQYAAEALYWFGTNEQFYGGFRYNAVKNQINSEIQRMEASLGWTPVRKVLIKAEYVNQHYSNFDVFGGNAGFSGIMLESTVSF